VNNQQRYKDCEVYDDDRDGHRRWPEREGVFEMHLDSRYRPQTYNRAMILGRHTPMHASPSPALNLMKLEIVPLNQAIWKEGMKTVASLMGKLLNGGGGWGSFEAESDDVMRGTKMLYGNIVV